MAGRAPLMCVCVVGLALRGSDGLAPLAKVAERHLMLTRASWPALRRLSAPSQHLTPPRSPRASPAAARRPALHLSHRTDGLRQEQALCSAPARAARAAARGSTWCAASPPERHLPARAPEAPRETRQRPSLPRLRALALRRPRVPCALRRQRAAAAVLPACRVGRRAYAPTPATGWLPHLLLQRPWPAPLLPPLSPRLCRWPTSSCTSAWPPNHGLMAAVKQHATQEANIQL